MPESIQHISVIVPKNPFVRKDSTKNHCLCVFDVENLMRWWPGTPHAPHRNATKVQAIQRSLDWKRVAQIAAYLLQTEIYEVSEKIDRYFRKIYEPKKHEPGREWPPRIGKTIGYERSEYQTFSNILVHINGAELKEKKVDGKSGAGQLIFDENNPQLFFSVIDGQHRINGAYLAVKLLKEKNPAIELELPAEVFLNLDERDHPRLQAQIFIDVNFYQKKVDRSLVADLFPTARGPRGPLDNKERAQDIGRKLMLETGPLVGMIQIPGIKFGYKDVITLATLNGAIEDLIDILNSNGIESLDSQTVFLAQCLTAWLEASGRFEKFDDMKDSELDRANVTYQGRVLTSVLTLIPAMIWKLRMKRVQLISEKAADTLKGFLKTVAANANLVQDGEFIDKSKFKERGFLGSGGIARFRDLLWASAIGNKAGRFKQERIAKLAEKNRSEIYRRLSDISHAS
jgi:DGQHR domain-containing protein